MYFETFTMTNRSGFDERGLLIVNIIQIMLLDKYFIWLAFIHIYSQNIEMNKFSTRNTRNKNQPRTYNPSYPKQQTKSIIRTVGNYFIETLPQNKGSINKYFVL